MLRPLMTVPALAAAAVLLASCSGTSGAADSSSTGPAGRPSAPAPATAGAGGAAAPASSGDQAAGWYVPPQVTGMPEDGSVRIVDPAKVSAPEKGFATAEGGAQLVTPGGTVGCTLAGNSIVCSLPPGLAESGNRLPDAAEYCSSSSRITGVMVSQKGNAYLCGAAPATVAVPRTPDTAWAGSNPEVVATRSGPAVVLPHERGVSLGPLQCISRDAGVTCQITTVGSGFVLTPRGIDFFGTAPGTHSQYD